MNDRSSRLGVTLRHGERVSNLELFFDLVFVLAITQCTALMAGDSTWTSIGQGLVVLGLLWWAWVGYAWLTSVVDPDEGGVRAVLFAAMAALLVASLCIPGAFGDLGVTFVVAYGAVRVGQIVLFVLASGDDAGLRHSVIGLLSSTAIGVAILVAGSQFHGSARLAVWAVALVFDMAGPLLIDTAGWRLAPGHFADRHGLILLVALGESIVAIGVGADADVDRGVIAAAVAGMALAAAFWWGYFDVASLVASQRLASIDGVKERNELARDAYSYLHLPMIVAIVLVALGMKHTLAHVTEPLTWVTATALVGGTALYLLSHVVFKRRAVGAVGLPRLVAAIGILGILPLATRIDSLAALAAVAVVSWAAMAVEAVRFADDRREIRRVDHQETSHGGEAGHSH